MDSGCAKMCRALPAPLCSALGRGAALCGPLAAIRHVIYALRPVPAWSLQRRRRGRSAEAWRIRAGGAPRFGTFPKMPRSIFVCGTNRRG